MHQIRLYILVKLANHINFHDVQQEKEKVSQSQQDMHAHSSNNSIMSNKHRKSSVTCMEQRKEQQQCNGLERIPQDSSLPGPSRKNNFRYYKIANFTIN